MIKVFDGIVPVKGFLYFTAPWCASCKSLAPVLEKSKVSVTKLDVSDPVCEQIANKYEVEHLPTMVRLSDNKYMVGSHQLPEIEEFLNGN